MTMPESTPAGLTDKQLALYNALRAQYILAYENTIPLMLCESGLESRCLAEGFCNTLSAIKHEALKHGLDYLAITNPNTR